MVKKVRTLLIGFEQAIHPNELHAFRGAIVERAGRKHLLFHNHIEDNLYLYSYPKIQYKLIQNTPHIICLDEGIEEIHHFFTQKEWDFYLYDRYYKVQVKKLLVNQFNMQVWSTPFYYKIYQWHALNQKNYQIYRQLTCEEDKLQMLNKILTANILSFAKGINWRVEKPIVAEITSIQKERSLPYKDIKIMSIDAVFKTNVFLPNYIGLGKNVSLGYGTIKQIKNFKVNENGN